MAVSPNMTQKSEITKNKTDESNYVRIKNVFVAKATGDQQTQEVNK